MASNQMFRSQNMVKVSFDQALEKFLDVFLKLHPKSSF